MCKGEERETCSAMTEGYKLNWTRIDARRRNPKVQQRVREVEIVRNFCTLGKVGLDTDGLGKWANLEMGANPTNGL